MPDPRLRNVDKVPPPYPLGQFPTQTIQRIAERIVYSLHVRGDASLEGKDFESIFAYGIGADWTPSNVGLDDIRLKNCCWGAKTVKNNRPSQAKRLRLISGRNSLDYSYRQSDSRGLTPAEIGERVLGIWNARVASIRGKFEHCRTAVLIKSDDLSECALFEFETTYYDHDRYQWSWNKNGNLIGLESHGKMKFTWQPHGSQFTIAESVPANRFAFRLRLPEPLPFEVAMKALGFDDSWIEIL